MENRTTTDAVHERFQAVEYKCNNCGMKFRGTHIRHHYRDPSSHKTKEKCSYCFQPAYQYETETGEAKVWHECPKS